MNQIKKFFETPKKALVSTICIVVVLGVVGMAAVVALNGSEEKKLSSGKKSNTAAAKITLEEAEAIAFGDAGFDDSDITYKKTKLGMEDGIAVYEIDFGTTDTKYEYEVDASSGAICGRSKETIVKQTAQDQTSEEQAVQEQTSEEQTGEGQNGKEQTGEGQNGKEQSQVISLEQAKKAALSDAGVSSSDADYTQTNLEYEDGVSVYEIDFYTSTHKYEYEINAVTGAVRSKEVETRKTNTENTDRDENPESYIGVDRAKSIAVSHAGLSEDTVTFSKAKLEREDGQKVYEVEFYKDGKEYEYTINAATGSVAAYDVE